MDKKRITIAFLIVLTNAIGATAILPMLPIYAEGQLQATPFQALLVIPVYYAAQFVAAPWLGRLSDRYGRRPVLIISQIGTLASYLLFIFAIPAGSLIGFSFGISNSLLIVYLARLLDGLTGGNVSAAEAYASDISDEKSRAQALGLIGGAVGLGHILGPALAVALSGIGLIAPMWGALVVSGVTLVLTIVLLEEPLTLERRSATQSSTPTTSLLQQIANGPIALVLATAFIVGLYLATLLSSFSLYAERILFPDQPAQIVVRNVSLLVTASGLIAAICQIFLIGTLVRWFGEQRLIVIGSVLLLGSAVGISAGSLTLVLASIFMYALGYAMTWPSMQTILTRLGPGDSAGRLLGLFQSAFSLSFIVSPLLAGLLLEAWGPQSIFQGGALLMGMATILAIFILRLSLPASAVPVSNRDSIPPDSYPDHKIENAAD